jgi:hypothetical protein
MKSVFLALAAIAVLLATATTASADATPVRTFSEGMSAGFDSTSGCIELTASIGFDRSITFQPSQTSEERVDVLLNKFDACTNTYLVVAQGTLTLDSLKVTQDLSSAHGVAHGTIAIADFTGGGSLNITADVTFSGAGDVNHSAAGGRFCGTAGTLICSNVGASRTGTGSGTISDGSTNYGGTATSAFASWFRETVVS